MIFAVEIIIRVVSLPIYVVLVDHWICLKENIIVCVCRVKNSNWIQILQIMQNDAK